eukprot:TRINITY_DN67124_c8_g1_i1.p2 TRINITY_DN67124_c8_g1~~TRINITY_DN67124_c8_g1_i1.p2  ORF type:complete len:276 (+),score=137.28 TRINITY_DN67124_c8_g1_i1:48-875(+)
MMMDEDDTLGLDLSLDDHPPARSNNRNNKNNKNNNNKNKNASPMELDADDGKETAAVTSKKKKRAAAAPKFTVETLFGPTGVPKISQHMPKLKLKGKGHERSDLRKLMIAYRDWATAMFPSMPFDDLVARIEQFGSTKEAKANIANLRAHARGEYDYVDDFTTQQVVKQRIDAEFDNRDAILQQRVADNQRAAASSAAVGSSTSSSSSSSSSNRSSTNNTSSGSSGLSEEQRRRIEENRRKALEKRAQRQAMEAMAAAQRQDDILDELMMMEELE